MKTNKFLQTIKRGIFFGQILLVVILIVNVANAQTTEFTYQGRLIDNSLPANASYDFEFRLFGVATGGSALATQTRLGVPVSNGAFTVGLDFGALFNGQPRFLEIAVKPAGSADPFTVLTPRQPITSVPYAIRSLNSGTADTAANSLRLGGIVADQYIITTDSRLSDARNPLPGSGNYIQNTTVQQPASNYYISGNGTAGGTLSGNVVNTATQYDIAQNRVLSVGGIQNTFVGVNAGEPNPVGGSNTFVGYQAGTNITSGNNNSFFGRSAGPTTTTGIDNSFFGSNTGVQHTTGSFNSFFGRRVGESNTTGSNNSFFGYKAGAANLISFNSFFGSNAGESNTNGTDNSFFGGGSGAANTVGSHNSFFGRNAGLSNTASSNSFFGSSAGDSNTSGTFNSFFGHNAGQSNVTGNFNSFFGQRAGFSNTASNNSFFGYNAGHLNTSGDDNSFFGYRSGAANTAGVENSFFGFNAGQSNISGDNNAFFGYQAGLANTANGNSFFGSGAGDSNDAGIENVFIGRSAGTDNNIGDFNVFVGSFAGTLNTTGNNNTVIGRNANLGSSNLNYATTIGADSVVSVSNTIVLGRNSGSDTVRVPGKLAVNTLGATGSENLCRNPSDQIAECSSSLRYKTNIAPFNFGLTLVNRLRPISFEWKDGGMKDLGLGAEDVAAIEPLLVTYNKAGEVEGVKYDRIGVVLLNAVKEQQAQIETQQKQIEQQQKQLLQQQLLIDSLKNLICSQNPQAEVCKEIQK